MYPHCAYILLFLLKYLSLPLSLLNNIALYACVNVCCSVYAGIQTLKINVYLKKQRKIIFVREHRRLVQDINNSLYIHTRRSKCS